jgi:hypothetical protein
MFGACRACHRVRVVRVVWGHVDAPPGARSRASWSWLTEWMGVPRFASVADLDEIRIVARLHVHVAPRALGRAGRLRVRRRSKVMHARPPGLRRW